MGYQCHRISQTVSRVDADKDRNFTPKSDLMKSCQWKNSGWAQAWQDPFRKPVQA